LSPAAVVVREGKQVSMVEAVVVPVDCLLER
jgi:hypothetical protein